MNAKVLSNKELGSDVTKIADFDFQKINFSVFHSMLKQKIRHLHSGSTFHLLQSVRSTPSGSKVTALVRSSDVTRKRKLTFSLRQTLVPCY